jgi:hypothetical protein
LNQPFCVLGVFRGHGISSGKFDCGGERQVEMNLAGVERERQEGATAEPVGVAEGDVVGGVLIEQGVVEEPAGGLPGGGARNCRSGFIPR